MASLAHASVGVVVVSIVLFLVRSTCGLFVVPIIQHNTRGTYGLPFGTKATSRESYHQSQPRKRSCWKTCFSGTLSSSKSIRRMSPLSEEDKRQDEDDDSSISTGKDANDDEDDNENLNQQWKDFQNMQTLLRQSDLFQPKVLPQGDDDGDNGTTVAVGIFFLIAVLCLGGIYWNMNHYHLMATSLSTTAPTGIFESSVLDDDDVDSAKGRFQALTGGVWF